MSDAPAAVTAQSKAPDKFKRLKLSSVDWTHGEGDHDHFMFRVEPRTMGLTESIGRLGQQVPVIVRPHPSPPSKQKKYQLICGFRRCTALHELGREEVDAIIRELDDDEAIALSFTENCERKSYTTVEKANAVAMVMRRKGLSDNDEGREVAVQMLGIGERQTRNFLRFLDMEDSVKAEADKDSHFRMTHALEMYRVLGKYAGVQVPLQSDPDPEKHLRLVREWMGYINEEHLGVKAIRDLEERLNEADRITPSAGRVKSLIASETKTKKGKTEIKFGLRKLVLEDLSDEDCRAIRGQLTQLLDRIPRR